MFLNDHFEGGRYTTPLVENHFKYFPAPTTKIYSFPELVKGDTEKIQSLAWGLVILSYLLSISSTILDTQRTAKRYLSEMGHTAVILEQSK